MRGKTQNHSIDSLIALVLFGVFAACILMVLLTGAEAYRRLTERDRDGFGERTCLQYVATKIRQAESGEGIYIEDLGGVEALCIPENIGERVFVTRIYCYDGWLREIFTSASAVCEPSDGEKIIKIAGLDFRLEDGLLTVAQEREGGEDSLELTLSLRGEGAPA